MRLFIAVDPTPTARAAISASLASLRETADCLRRGLSGTVSWVEERNLHVTVHFLREIDDARVPALQSSLARPLALEPDDVSFGGWGVYPSHGPPRVVWVGVNDGLMSLERAHRVLGERLAALGVTLESRRFSPHLTVGRVKAPCGEGLRDLVARADRGADIRCTVSRCTLYRSRLSPGGATYEALTHIPFQS